jgi:hypothetical protein
MDDAGMDSSPPTPNTDDTPYIRFAIDQLTRDEEVGGPRSQSTAASSESYPVDRIVPTTVLPYPASTRARTLHTREELALARKHRSSPDAEHLFRFNATRPLSPNAQPSDPNLRSTNDSAGEMFIPVPPPQYSPRYPDLTFLPTILRPFSMIMLALLCLLMIAAIMFSAIYSTHHNGLADWAGFYGGRYFVFSFLPQILAACIFVYVQCVMATITRIMPFTMMAMDDAESRSSALFLGIYPRNMFFPRWEGPVTMDFTMTFFWLVIFTIPLQGCLFSVIPVDDIWRWTAVQGIAWTLVALYVLILLATVVTVAFFFRRTTGLMWDPRSLTDLIALLPRSNSLRDYSGTDIMRDRSEITHRLALRSDRLGYWKTQDMTQGLFYCVGEQGASTRRYTLEAGKLSKTEEKEAYADEAPDIEKTASIYNRATRFRYIPWQLRDTFVIFWCVAALILLIALLVVSFLPSTALRKGFLPLVSAYPNRQGYSTANLLYSFIPSVLGMILYLLFQPLDTTLRYLQPWAELGHPEGSTGYNSLLLDYAAAFPISCTIKALTHGHYRIATTSLLSPLFLLLPLLAGGLFFPLTTPSGEVRILPNLPSFYIIITLLILYLLALLLLLPNRHTMRLPHGVSCLAEIFSFVYNAGLLDDAAFRAPRSKADLVARVTAVGVKGGKKRYAFGVYRGRNGRECLGIERLGRKGAPEVMILTGR